MPNSTDPAYVDNLEQALKDIITASYGTPNIQGIAQRALNFEAPAADPVEVVADPEASTTDSAGPQS